MTEAEVANDFAAVLRKIQHGAEVIVDRNGTPFAVIKPAEPEPRTLSELISLAEQREIKRGSKITLDDNFAADVEEIVNARKPWLPQSWVGDSGIELNWPLALPFSTVQPAP